MATVILEGFDELQDAFKEISTIPASVTRKAVKAMGEVAVRYVKAEGEAMGIRSDEDGAHVLDNISFSKPKKGRDGNMKGWVVFTGTRMQGDRKIWNAAIAYLNEYGSPRRDPPIPPRPFIRTGLAKGEAEITAAAEEIIGDFIEKTFGNG